MNPDKKVMALSTSMMVLSLIENGDKYGYEIIKILEERSNDVFELKEGTLYPILHKLQSQGYVKSYEQENDNGKTRKYYTITDKGRKLLSEKKTEWKIFTSAVNNVIGAENYA